MALLDRLRGLSGEEWRVLIEALLCVATVRLGLWVLPFGIVRRLAGGEGLQRDESDAAPLCVPQVVWAVGAAGRLVPGATCLTRALATRLLLRRRGIASQLCIGVQKEGGGPLIAHAWVECGGQVVIGGPDVGLYVPLRGPIEGQL